MPYSTDLAYYPEECHTILNHAFLYGTASVPATERSPHTLRLYFHSFRKAVAAELEKADAAVLPTLREAYKRYQMLTFQVQLDPPALVIARRDNSVLGRLLRETSVALTKEEFPPGSLTTAEALERQPPPMLDSPPDMDDVVKALFKAERARLPEDN